MEFEEYNKEKGFVTIYDDDGLVTIQLNESSLKTIIHNFDGFIKNKIDITKTLKITEFNKSFKLKLSLKHDTDNFKLSGSYDESTNFYHDFDLEECDINTWKKIKEINKLW